MKEFFKDMIEDALLNNDMSIVYMVFTSLISANSNKTNNDIKRNCESLVELIDVLSNYSNSHELQNIKEKAIKYNEKYLNLQ